MVPLIAVITSPWTRPALAAGVPDWAPATSAPEVVCWLAIPMPMNAVAPMWTTDDSCPASICLAMDSAVLIGIA